jgi:hypothetical protein
MRCNETRRHTPLSGSGFYNSSLRLDVVLISHSAPSLTDSQRTVVLLQQKGRTHGWVDVGLDEVTRFGDERDSDDFIFSNACCLGRNLSSSLVVMTH